MSLNKEGIDYIKRNFQYSILENYNAKVDDSVILERESWWVCASKHESGRLIAVEMLSPIFEQKASKSILSLASTFAVSVACAIINSFVFG